MPDKTSCRHCGYSGPADARSCARCGRALVPFGTRLAELADRGLDNLSPTLVALLQKGYPLLPG